jgi:hypothetical protein
MDRWGAQYPEDLDLIESLALLSLDIGETPVRKDATRENQRWQWKIHQFVS